MKRREVPMMTGFEMYVKMKYDVVKNSMATGGQEVTHEEVMKEMDRRWDEFSAETRFRYKTEATNQWISDVTQERLDRLAQQKK